MRFAASLVACCVLVANITAAQGGSVNLTALLELYSEGKYDEAVAKAAAVPDLGPLRLRFVQDTPAWVNAEGADVDRRRAVVAAFLAELTAARLESDWGRLSDLIEWTCTQILRTGPPTEFERRWHMATTALAGRARTRIWLLGPYARLPHQKPIRRTPQKDDPPSPLHLMHAIERFPEDPHFQLARVIAWTWGRDAEPMRNRPSDWRNNPAPQSRPAQLEAVTALEPLLKIAGVAAEAHLRTGLILVSVGDHNRALQFFDAALPLAKTTQLQYLSHFLAARSLEVLQQPDAAASRYQDALTLVPDAESSVIALASLQFARGDVDAPLAAVARRFEKPTSATDPGRLIGYGFFLHWPDIKAAMRAELPK